MKGKREGKMINKNDIRAIRKAEYKRAWYDYGRHIISGNVLVLNSFVDYPTSLSDFLRNTPKMDDIKVKKREKQGG